MPGTDYQGLLVIGDPHLEGRQPGFRKDDYPNVVLNKLAWCLEYAARERLLPAILGDLFEKPRDNPTWMLGRVIEMLRTEVIGLYGNHDCAEPTLTDHDSFSLLLKAGRLRLVDEANPWQGTMNGRKVLVGGSSWRKQIPTVFAPGSVVSGARPLVVWLTHHDILVPGHEEEGRISPCEIDGVDLVVNGHIHTRLADLQLGRTLWLTPGNIARRSRIDAVRAHRPAALRLDVTRDGFTRRFIEVPHRPFDEVFHEAVTDVAVNPGQSAFIVGLAELQARRTASGAGLWEFLNQNLWEFEPAVADEIRALAREVTSNGEEQV
jgi:DNA repair exonuclease SbcCD nuclease subunit